MSWAIAMGLHPVLSRCEPSPSDGEVEPHESAFSVMLRVHQSAKAGLCSFLAKRGGEFSHDSTNGQQHNAPGVVHPENAMNNNI